MGEVLTAVWRFRSWQERGMSRFNLFHDFEIFIVISQGENI